MSEVEKDIFVHVFGMEVSSISPALETTNETWDVIETYLWHLAYGESLLHFGYSQSVFF